jgi:DUF1365 family protein
MAASGATPDAGLASAVYTGRVLHRRHSPHAHAFGYRLFMMYIDLDELPRLFAGRWLWSLERANLASFRRADYLGDPQQPLADAVRSRIAAAGQPVPTGPIRLLTHLRYFGYCFNPVSFYYCFDADGSTLHTIVAEITNTPWKERHAYVLPVADATHDGHSHHWAFDKCFHVSPFLPMDRHYRWRLSVPGERLDIHMDIDDATHRQFDATLSLRRQPLGAGSLARVLVGFPLMTMRVVAAIHWQALLIWLKRNPVYDHTPKPQEPSSR